MSKVNENRHNRESDISPRAISIIVMLFGLALTIVITYTIYKIDHERELSVFESDSKLIHRSVVRTMDRHLASLNAVGKYFDAEFDITRSKFERFAGDIATSSAGFQALEWIPRVPHEQRQKLESVAQFSGVAGFGFKELGPDGNLIRAKDRTEYFPVYYAEPLSDNFTVLGFDLGSNPARKFALELARDTGDISFTEPIKLVQEEGSQSGVLAFRPVYRRDRSTETEDQRREFLVGYALAVFRIGDIIKQSEYEAVADVEFAIYDTTTPSERSLLFSSFGAANASTPSANGAPMFRLEMTLFPRNWVFEFFPRAGHALVSTNTTAIIVGLAGILISGLAALAVASLYGRKVYAETLVREQTEEISRRALELEEETEKYLRLSEEHEEARRQADAANVSKSEFLASMSHEIRTPMTGVMGFADLLLEDDLIEESREKVYKIKDSTRSLLRIINDILDMSKLEAGKVELEYLDFHLPSLVEDVEGLFSEKRSGKRAKAVDLVTDLSDDFPVAINSDPTRLRQVLINLVGNAMKFTEQGCVTVRGELTNAGGSAQMLRFSITDTGIGIKPEILDELFSEFTQADASITRKFEGTGLGLSISKQLILLMDGDIGVESTYGEGSTFWFTVPYIAATTEVEEPGMRTRVVANYRASRGQHILIVDDNGLNQQIVAAVLGGFGHTFEVAENGMEAVEMHERGRFDLILMDVRMPVMSGPDATRLIRNMDDGKDKIPIIALTADAMEEHKKGYFEAGMDSVVTKPIDRSALAIAMNDVFGEEINVPVAAPDAAEKPKTPANDENDAATKVAVDDFLNQIEVSDD